MNKFINIKPHISLSLLKFTFMGLLNFLKSKSFFYSLIFAAAFVVILGFGVLKFLDIYTRHGEEIEIPDLRKLSADDAQSQLHEMGFEIVVIDTIDFTNEVPPLSIAWQDPAPKTFVKEGRKIYVKLNAKNYSSIRLPKLENRSYRHALANIEMLGLLKGEVTYEPDFAKDVVLRVEQDGRILREGDKVLKNSKINFVLGDGSLGYKPKLDTIDDAFEDVAPKMDSIF